MIDLRISRGRGRPVKTSGIALIQRESGRHLWRGLDPISSHTPKLSRRNPDYITMWATRDLNVSWNKLERAFYLTIFKNGWPNSFAVQPHDAAALSMAFLAMYCILYNRNRYELGPLHGPKRYKVHLDRLQRKWFAYFIARAKALGLWGKVGRTINLPKSQRRYRKMSSLRRRREIRKLFKPAPNPFADW